VLRILKMITPVKCVIPRYDGFILRPEEGELHRRYPKESNVVLDQLPVAWSVNIDKSEHIIARGLRLLWDA
jgi:hypothetical protein